MGKCFVIRPFASAHENVWQLAIRPAVQAASLDPWDGQEDRLGYNIIHKDISRLIWESKLVIADLTSMRPNVMYELGLAHAAKKTVIMLIDQNEKPPFDIAHVRYLTYDPASLVTLRDELTRRILSALDESEETEAPDLFPELSILTDDIRTELEYLRTTTTSVNVAVSPASADVFFNDQLVGTGPQTIRVNPNASRNTVSASAIGFFEYHAEISSEDIESEEINISLKKVHEPGADLESRLTKRVPVWLRDRRRDPSNPVLMRAISSYLLHIGQRNDAYEEIQDLLAVAPGWFMSLNQMGLYHYGEDNLRAIDYYKQVAAMKPNHFIGHFNLACVHSLLGNLEDCIAQLRNILSNPEATDTIRHTMSSLSHDPDFQNVVHDPHHAPSFREIELELFPESKDLDWRKELDAGFYTY